jgi:hypothetical protein
MVISNFHITREEIPFPGLILEYSILVTFKEENSSISIPIPANMTISYHDYLNNTVINSTLSLSSVLLSLYYNGTEMGEVWENITTRKLQEIFFNQSSLLALFYQFYQNGSVQTSYTPFWIFQRNWTLGERFGAYNYNLTITKITTVGLSKFGNRISVMATVNRSIPGLQDNATLIYDGKTGLLIKGEILNYNALFYDPPRYYTTRLELVRTTYVFPILNNSTTVTSEETIPLPTEFIDISRSTNVYIILVIVVPVVIVILNFVRLRRIQGGNE